MKAYYDFHIHSALSPCADDEMTPCSIVSMASVKGLNAIAITDHNAVENVEVAMKYGNLLDIVIVPAMELQTNEDIHVLTYFGSFQDLNNFYQSIDFQSFKNNEDIYGRQLIIDEDDNVIGKLDRLLHIGVNHSIYEIAEKVKSFKGLLYPAHINREANGILNILGEIPSDINFDGIEYTKGWTTIEKINVLYKNIIYNSDAHCLANINEKQHHINVESLKLQDVFKAMKG